jgi:hypothetical protein
MPLEGAELGGGTERPCGLFKISRGQYEYFVSPQQCQEFFGKGRIAQGRRIKFA